MNQKVDDFTKLATTVDEIYEKIKTFQNELESASNNEQRFELHTHIYDYVTKKDFSDDMKTCIHNMIDTVLPEDTEGGKKTRKLRKVKKSRKIRNSRKIKH